MCNFRPFLQLCNIIKRHEFTLAGVEGLRGSTSACGTVTSLLDHPELALKHQKTQRRRRRLVPTRRNHPP
jgi:hypothetical protein